MKTLQSQKKTLLLALALALFSFGTAVEAQTSSSATNANSVYLYNALENKYSVAQLLNNEVKEEEKVEETVTDTPVIALSVPPLLTLEEKTRIQEEKVKVDYKELTRKQERIISEAEKAVEKISSQREWRSTVFGNNLGILEFHLVQVKGLRSSLNALTNKTVDVPLKLEIQDQVEVLEEQQARIESVLAERSDKFSFIGWLVATI